MLSISSLITALVLAGCSVKAVPLEQRGTTATTGTASGAFATDAGEYLWPIQVSSDPQTYKVVYDTGSLLTWVKQRNGRAGTGASFNISYSDGDWVAGNMEIGNLTIAGITLMNQPYGIASHWSRNDSSEGLVGLAPWSEQPGNGQHYASVQINLMPKLQQPWIGVDLQPSTFNSSGKEVPGGGEFALGWADNANIRSNGPKFLTHDTTHQSRWYMNVTGFGVPTGDTAATCDVDTGTGSLYVPTSVAQGYWKQVNGATLASDGHWKFPCSTALPDFKPVIGGTTITVPGKYLALPHDGKATTCTSYLRGTDGLCVFGQPFFHGQYVLFNFPDKTIAFAPK